ncbi:MAG: SUMF1/EgtB/PvdO family nonheme iron enzyme [Candidatus Latescibacteria bacterium]|nr:SUMF1/EgtB/PvdO family nonheme iron enzyme [Candidatus Latescibacterota bacterium]
MRTTRSLTGRRRAATPFALVLAALLAGCGAADLYESPESPFQVIGRVPLPSANEGVAALGDFAFVAGGEAGIHVIDITAPGAPVLVTTLNTTKYAGNIEVVRTFANATLSDLALVVEGTEGITTYDITDPAGIVSYEQGTTAVDGQRVFIEEPANPDDPCVVYLAESWKGLRIFETSPDFPGVLEYGGVFTGTQGYAKSVAVKDGYAYVADDEMGLAVVDVRVRILGQVRQVSWADTPGNALDVVVEGDYAYVADGVEGLAVFRVDGGETPVKVAQLDLTAYSRSLVVARGWALLCAADGGVHVVDVRDPEHPVYAGLVKTSYATDLCISPDGRVLVADRYDGLLVLSGPTLVADATPPAAVTTLAAAPLSATRVELSWLAVGDDGYYGTAASYLVRRAAAPIMDEADWEAALAVAGAPAPAAAGTRQTLEVTGLAPGTTYHFALRTLDDEGHLAALSNSASATTVEGAFLRAGGVAPALGDAATVFAFRVTFVDDTDAAPLVHDVTIDGVAHAMTLASGSPADGAVYLYETTLPAGAHEHAFAFVDALDRPVTLAPAAGPFVGNVAFAMGSPAGEVGRLPDEVLHDVLLSAAPVAGAREVTQAAWNLRMPANPSTFVGDELPVHNVTWLEAVAYCNLLSAAEGRTPAYAIDGPLVTWDREADGWRLPTESEWEYLCRAGTTTSLFNGQLVEQSCGADPLLAAAGWYCYNAAAGPQAVGLKLPNALGLFDVHGNVREWCWDWYGHYPQGPVFDPAGPADGDRRVVRGGSWHYYARECRSAARGAYYPTSADDYLGFRVVRNGE